MLLWLGARIKVETKEKKKQTASFLLHLPNLTPFP